MDAFASIFNGCWSSKEVEELSLTAGIALDKGKDSTIEKEDEEGGYPKKKSYNSYLSNC